MTRMPFGSVAISTKMQGMLPTLGAAERILVDYLTAHQVDAVQMSIEQLAAHAGVSYSTICRFCGKLGLKGYKELKNRLTAELLHNAPGESDFSEYEISRGESTRQICEKTFALFTGILNDCASLLELEVLERVVSILLGARTLYIIGAGASAASATYAHTRMLRLGIPCSVEADPTIYMMKAALMNEQDVMLAISSSGRTSSVVEGARQAKESGATVISISDYCVSPLQKCSNVSLFTTARNVGMHMTVDMPLTIGQIAIIDIVYSCCLAHLGEEGRRLYQRTKLAAEAGKRK